MRDLFVSLVSRSKVKPDVLGGCLVSADWHRKNPRSALEWIQRAERTTLRYALAQMAAIARHAADRQVARIGVPTLVLTGDEDRLVPHQNSQRLASLIPGAKLEGVPGAGPAFSPQREGDGVAEPTP